tara:strand:+ start:2446 stop:3015 length:570 start_codon:yes stop_codon:yes gene_type:complete
MHLGDYVKIVDGFFEEKNINLFLKVCETFTYKSSGIVTPVSDNTIDKNVRNVEECQMSKVHKSPTNITWNNYFRYKITKAVHTVYSQGLKHFPLQEIISLAVLKYKEGGFYNTHTDHVATHPRNLSVIIFLNDDYEGGEVEIFSPDEENSKIIEPKKGRMIIWPSNFLYPHKAHVVEKGVRYALVSWLL